MTWLEWIKEIWNELSEEIYKREMMMGQFHHSNHR